MNVTILDLFPCLTCRPITDSCLSSNNRICPKNRSYCIFIEFFFSFLLVTTRRYSILCVCLFIPSFTSAIICFMLLATVISCAQNKKKFVLLALIKVCYSDNTLYFFCIYLTYLIDRVKDIRFYPLVHSPKMANNGWGKASPNTFCLEVFFI